MNNIKLLKSSVHTMVKEAALSLPKVQAAPLLPPSCSQCKFYNPNYTCRKFSEISSMGDLFHPAAITMREDETKCGSKGTFYREKTEEDIQNEEDRDLWKDIRLPLIIYVMAIFAINWKK
jgi:hypothetical protein